LTVKRTAKPLSRIAVPVTAKGRKKPPASYMKAPMTGPMVRPKLKEESHQACNKNYRFPEI
jgi:hypothetical protein